MSASTSEPCRILIIPYGPGIGDLAQQKGLFAAVARQWPQADVSVFAPAGSQWLLPEGVTLRSRVLMMPAWNRVSLEKTWGLLGRWEQPVIERGFRLLPMGTLGRWPGAMMRRRFDLVVDFLSAFVESVDFERDWLPTDEGTTRHLLDIMTEYLDTLGVQVPTGQRNQAPALTPEDHEWAEGVLASAAFGEMCVLLNPHSGSSLKLPTEGFWARLIRLLGEQGITSLVVRGKGRAEEERATRLAASGGDLLQVGSLGGLTALSQRCLATISPDSGLLHLAALAGGSWVGLFGASNPYLVGPHHRSRGQLIVAEPPRGHACLTCWQRFTVGSACCPPFKKAGSCLSQLQPEQVLAAVESLR